MEKRDQFIMTVQSDGLSSSGSSSSCYNGELRGDVSYRNGHFIAVGKGIHHSKDGIEWTNTGDNGSYDAVAFSGDLMVAVSQDGNVVRSSNGNEWIESSHALTGLDEIDVTYGESGFLISGIDYGTNNYETTDDTCHLATSIDGTSWQNRSFTGCSTSQGAPVSQLSGVSAGFPDGGAFIIGDPEGQAMESGGMVFFTVNLGFAPSSFSIPVTVNDSTLALSPHPN